MEVMDFEDIVTQLRDAGAEEIRVKIHDGETVFLAKGELIIEITGIEKLNEIKTTSERFPKHVGWNDEEWKLKTEVTSEKESGKEIEDPDEVKYTRSDVVIYNRKREEELGNGYDIKSLYYIREKIEDEEFRSNLINQNEDFDEEIDM